MLSVAEIEASENAGHIREPFKDIHLCPDVFPSKERIQSKTRTIRVVDEIDILEFLRFSLFSQLLIDFLNNSEPIDAISHQDYNESKLLNPGYFHVILR